MKFIENSAKRIAQIIYVSLIEDFTPKEINFYVGASRTVFAVVVAILFMYHLIDNIVRVGYDLDTNFFGVFLFGIIGWLMTKYFSKVVKYIR